MMIAQAADRAAGTGLLEVACQHCSTKTFLQNFPAWSTQVLTIAKSHREEDQVLSMRAHNAIAIQGLTCTPQSMRNCCRPLSEGYCHDAAMASALYNPQPSCWPC